MDRRTGEGTAMRPGWELGQGQIRKLRDFGFARVNSDR
jgi:hypothetical protein